MRLGIGAVIEMMIFIICAVTSTVSAQVPLDGDSSRRISTCRYLIEFPSNSVKLTKSARATINEALEESVRNGNHALVVNPHWQIGENPELIDRRFDAIKQEFDRVKGFDDRILETHMSHPPPTRARAFINVCPPIDDTRYHEIPLPENPDRRIELFVGSARLAIPLRYLGPGFWRDTPLEPMYLGDQWQMEVSWSALQDTKSHATDGCVQSRAQARQCDIDILLYLQVLSARPFEGPQQPPSKLPTQYLPVDKDVYGAKFFVKKIDSVHQGGYFEAASDAGLLLGWCSWGAPASGLSVPTSEQIVAALDASGGSNCHLTNFRITDDLNAMAVFPGLLFRDWRILHASLVHLMAGFKEQAR